MEIWQPFPGTGGRYEVSNKGHVRALAREAMRLTRWGGRGLRRDDAHPIRPSDNGNGYKSVMLRVEDRSVRFYVHRAVLEAFAGPPPSPKHQAAHWDGNRANNKANNLRWALPKDNSRDKMRHGTVAKGPRAAHCPKGHPYSGDNLRIAGRTDRLNRICVTCQRSAARATMGSVRSVASRRRPLPKAVREAVLAVTGGKCAICTIALLKYEVDHILPIQFGGGDELSNLRALCAACHKQKSNAENTARAKCDRMRAKHLGTHLNAVDRELASIRSRTKQI